MKLKLLAGTIFLITVLNAASSYAGSGKAVFVLFDVSGSTQSSRKEYLDGFIKILDIRAPGEESVSALGLKDTIAADIITGNSLSTSELPIEHQFKYSFWSGQNAMFAGSKAVVEKKELAREAKDLLSDKTARGSDIMNSMRLAERVFSRYKKDKPVLVIFSDMIEQAGGYDFENDNLTEKRITAIIRQEQAKGLPDLRGVTVYVTGANAKSSTQFLKIRNFWIRYFKACGAVLDKANYGRAFMEISE
ncbi:MAG: hypothetical protein M0Z52_12280 [Actinomycetota bacterium]|nr:hypothetical protein [Nitrospiraceae bacterium]MDA8157206.1 hypothetical protein [Actinomycetota bacterium]